MKFFASVLALCCLLMVTGCESDNGDGMAVSPGAVSNTEGCSACPSACEESSCSEEAASDCSGCPAAAAEAEANLGAVSESEGECGGCPFSQDK